MAGPAGALSSSGGALSGYAGGGGAMSGAAMGSAVPGIGTAIGAGVGAIASGVGDNDASKKAAAQRKKEMDAQLSIPGRTKMSAIYDSFKEAAATKMRNMASLSQAAMEWAQLQR